MRGGSRRNMDVATYLADCDQRYSHDLQMVGVEWQGPGYHTRVPNGSWVHPTRESLDYALALLIDGAPAGAERAAAIIGRVLSLQDTDPTSRAYGIWPWLLEEPLDQMAPPDWNWADFCGARLAQMLRGSAALLPSDLQRAMRASLGHAAWSIFRRNVQPGYTNIAIMGAGVAAAAGELLDEPRLVDYGRQRLQKIVDHTAYHGGFNEYNSPTYTLVALHECERTLYLVRDQAARAAAEALRQTAWRTLAEHFHPATGQLAGPHSRAYGDRLNPEAVAYLSAQTGVSLHAHPAPWPRGKPAPVLVPPLPCPPALVERFRALPQPEVELRQRFVRHADEARSVWGVTWLSEAACLGSINHDSLWAQRRVLLGYWRTADDPAVVLRMRFLRDQQDFASAYVRNDQRGPRVLSAISLLTDRGDFHPTLDRPADGVFFATDMRLRYELTGAGALVRALDANRFELAAGDYRAVIVGLPGRFGPYTVRWEAGSAPGRAWVDGVCYQGERRPFAVATFDEVLLVAGLELLHRDAAPAHVMPHIVEQGGSVVAEWPASPARTLQVIAPLRAHPYE